jgi:DNA-binding transcriptional LysR family regulator
LELRDIEYFGVIAEHKHLGRAAEALGLSVPAVSKSLRRLETATDAKLVTRTHKGVELTAEGAALLSHVRDLRVSVRDITRQLADMRQGRVGDIHVGAPPGHAEYLLPPACSALYASGAGVTVSVLVGSKDVTLPALLQGELDLVITDPAIAIDGGLLHEPVYDDSVLLTSAFDHPLAAKGRLTLADLVGERWALPNSRTHGQLCEMFRKCGLPLPQVALLTNSSSLRLRTVAMSRLLGTFSVPASYAFAEARSQLKILPVEDLVWKRSFCVAYRSSASLSPAVRRLIEELRTAAQARRDVPASMATESMI